MGDGTSPVSTNSPPAASGSAGRAAGDNPFVGGGGGPLESAPRAGGSPVPPGDMAGGPGREVPGGRGFGRRRGVRNPGGDLRAAPRRVAPGGGGHAPPREQPAPRRRALEPEEDPRRRRLAAAGLADEAERLLPPDGEADAVDGLHVAGGAREEQARDDREMLRDPVDANQLGRDGAALQQAPSHSEPTVNVGGYSARQRSSA